MYIVTSVSGARNSTSQPLASERMCWVYNNETNMV